jgi:predicted permease
VRTFLSRLLDIVLRRSREDRLSEEVQSHLDLLTDDFVAKGLSPDDAKLAARKAFGGVDQVKEHYRDRRGLPFFDHLVQDLRFAGRLLRRDPLLVMAAALSLAIGIGASTTVFTVANTLLLRPPDGMQDGAALVDISRRDDDGGFGVKEISFPNFLDVRERATTLADVCGYDVMAQPMSLIASGARGGAERVFGNTVTPNYFDVLGVTPAAGRLFEPSSAASMVVLSHRFWSRRFNGDSQVIGQALTVNGRSYTIAGVAAESFRGTSLIATDVWIAVEMNPAADSFLRRRELNWGVARGRLKPGISAGMAGAEVDAIGRALAREYPDQNAKFGLRLARASVIPGNLALPIAGLMSLIFGFVSLVLAVACANLAGLLLARAGTRRHEIALRLALGAGRARIVRQLLTETLALFVLGGGFGILLARTLTSVIVSLMPGLPVPVDLSFPLDARVLAFSAALSLAAAIVCGLVPAMASARSDVISTLKNDGPAASGRTRLRHAFVVVQVAASIVLIIGAGLFARALQQAAMTSTGFDASAVELAEVDLGLGGYTPITGPPFAVRIAERIRSMPGVDSATIAATAPTAGRLRLGFLTLPGREAQGRPTLDADWNAIAPGYFATLRTPLLEGRDFSDADAGSAQQVAIVSETAAKTFWPGQPAIGQFLRVSPNVVRRGQPNESRTLVVVGVASDIRTRAGAAPTPQLYVPLQQQYVSRLTVIARSTNGERLAQAIRGAMTSLDPGVPILSSQTLDESAALTRLPQRVAVIVSGSLGFVSLLLTALGLYAVVAYTAAQRTREIGIRVALGAAPSAVVAMILRVGAVLVAAGSAIGIAVAAAAGMALPKMLAGFPSLDLLTFAGTTAFYAAIALTACYLPARRAAGINPAATLRKD